MDPGSADDLEPTSSLQDFRHNKGQEVVLGKMRSLLSQIALHSLVNGTAGFECLEFDLGSEPDPSGVA
jgi:hypothetical protein